MTNGDRIRTFGDELLALTIMCPVESHLTGNLEEITQLYEKGECKNRYESCLQCCYKWLKQEEI